MSGWDSMKGDQPTGPQAFSSLFSVIFFIPKEIKPTLCHQCPLCQRDKIWKPISLSTPCATPFFPLLFFFYIWLPCLIEWMVRWALLWFNVLSRRLSRRCLLALVSAGQYAHAQLPRVEMMWLRAPTSAVWSQNGRPLASGFLRGGRRHPGRSIELSGYCYKSIAPRAQPSCPLVEASPPTQLQMILALGCVPGAALHRCLWHHG